MVINLILLELSRLVKYQMNFVLLGMLLKMPRTLPYRSSHREPRHRYRTKLPAEP